MSSELISQLYAIFGETAVLLPIKPGEKKPVHAGWEKTTWEASQAPDYQLTLQGGSIGILMGVERLVAIDIDHDEDVEPFLRLNPGLRQTVISRGSRGVKLFIRLKVDKELEARGFPSWPLGIRPGQPDQKVYNILKPPAADAKKGEHWGELRMRGCQCVIWGKHPSGNDYQLVAAKPSADGSLNLVDVGLEPAYPVKEVYFDEIAWPAQVNCSWRVEEWDTLTRLYGRPWTCMAPAEGEEDAGCTIAAISEHFWAGWFSRQHHIMFEPIEVRFYRYNPHNGAWQIREDAEIRKMISDDLLRISRCEELQHICYTVGQQPAGWDRLKKGSLSKLEGPGVRSQDRIGSILGFLKGEVTKREVFKTGEGVIHLQNGMIDLREGRANQLTLKPFSPKFYSRNPIPVAFNPEARASRFMNDLLKRALPIKEDCDLFLRWGGQVVLGRNDSQKVMIMTGTAGGGKSTVMKILQLLIGRPNVAQLRTENLEGRFELFAYVGKTLLSGVDVPGNFLMQKGAYIIKGLTGGDWMDAEVKGGKEFLPITGDYNCGVTCNSRLKVKMHGDHEAWRRRLIELPFTAPPIEEDKKMDHFAEWLVEHEGSGILNQLIRGAQRVLKARGRIEMTEGQQKRVNDLLDESDSVRVFLRACVEPSKGDHILTDDLCIEYANFCENNGWEAENERGIQRQIKGLMLEMFRCKSSNSLKGDDGKAKVGYRGVRFKPEPDAVEDPEDGDLPL
ncbi:bifunctional DNA primase/polymerase [Cerasicoccus arenae]|uniref:SF3 helicase domain-containing protein n=1 Tax=Cerasicoccus arenae TaxID=424488 RepID=A0A8J3DHS9_9BACT|nr:bifunctional DNA primase/polymerase [Cerasicoccus arenae]MBK1858223.1 bifunctional DNA primase/polymerase [Cerasicoccus arenae]GHC01999.1 hypothetical protein GCM10007047_18100 [Cerasicoccus arenae]